MTLMGFLAFPTRLFRALEETVHPQVKGLEYFLIQEQDLLFKKGLT